MSKKCTPLWREADFQVQMFKKTPCSDHFSKLTCRKSAHGCGVKHISKSKVLDFQMLFCVAGAKDCAPCQKWENLEGFVAVSTTTTTTLHCNYNYNCHCHCNCTTLHYTDYITLHYTTPHHTTLTTTASYNYATSTTLNYTRLHYTRLHYITLHYTHYTTTNATATTLH